MGTHTIGTVIDGEYVGAVSLRFRRDGQPNVTRNGKARFALQIRFYNKMIKERVNKTHW